MERSSQEESSPLHSEYSNSHSVDDDEDEGVKDVVFGDGEQELGAETEDDDGDGSSHLQACDDDNDVAELGFLNTCSM